MVGERNETASRELATAMLDKALTRQEQVVEPGQAPELIRTWPLSIQ